MRNVVRPQCFERTSRLHRAEGLSSKFMRSSSHVHTALRYHRSLSLLCAQIHCYCHAIIASARDGGGSSSRIALFLLELLPRVLPRSRQPTTSKAPGIVLPLWAYISLEMNKEPTCANLEMGNSRQNLGIIHRRPPFTRGVAPTCPTRQPGIGIIYISVLNIHDPTLLPPPDRDLSGLQWIMNRLLAMNWGHRA